MTRSQIETVCEAMRVVFADTFYWVGVTLPNYPWAEPVEQACAELGSAWYVTTDEVLVEFLSYFSSRGEYLRRLAVRLVRKLLEDEDVTVIPQSRVSFLRGLDLYERRLDKGYSLVDARPSHRRRVFQRPAFRAGRVCAAGLSDRDYLRPRWGMAAVHGLKGPSVTLPAATKLAGTRL